MYAPFFRAFLASSFGLLAACSEPAPPPAAVVTPPAEPAAPAQETETISARYDCPTAGRLDIVRDGRYARLSMTDGRVIYIGAIQGSRPTIWSEVGLRFVVDGPFIELSQESGRAIRCTEAPVDTALDPASPQV